MNSAPDRMEQALSVDVEATHLERVVAYGIESERIDIRADAWSVFAEMIEGYYEGESGRMLPFLDLANEPIGSIRGIVERAIARISALAALRDDNERLRALDGPTMAEYEALVEAFREVDAALEPWLHGERIDPAALSSAMAKVEWLVPPAASRPVRDEEAAL